MSNKFILGLLLVSFLFLSLNQPIRCEAQSSTFQDWQVENRGGHYSESNGTLRMWTDGGTECPLIALYKQIKPTHDFTFSTQVNAQTAESCAIFVRNRLPVSSNLGFNLEYGHYGEGQFLLARNGSNWMANQVAYGDPNLWYTMQLSVSSSPFRIATTVFDENGTSIWSFSTSKISNFTFEDINFIGLVVWGYSPSDYLFRDIQNPFDNPASISISAESMSETAGSAVNIFGKLTDSENKPLQNKTVVLSHTFSGTESWIPISSGLTDEQGNYNIQWINSASGTFTLKTEWSGESSSIGVSNTTTLSFLPYQNKQVFLFESNSTVYELAFNNQTSTLSFNVNGPSGTTGYVIATISKTSLANGENLQVYMDGNQLNYSVASKLNSWVVTFNYSHSTHQIKIQLQSNVSSTQPLGNEAILIFVIALVCTILAITTVWIWQSRKMDLGRPTL
jgi:hypothetical protein